MFYAVVIYPKINTAKLEEFREKYDPLWPWIKPHITLVYPFDFKGEISAIEKHLEKILLNWNSFEIRLKGIEKAWDNFIYLTVTDGKNKLKKLHDQLYTGVLKEFLNAEIEYIPHLTIGLGNPDNVYQILKEAQVLNLEYTIKIVSVTLSSIDVDKKIITYEKTIKIK